MMFLLANWKLILIGLLVAATALCFKLWREEVRAFALLKAQVEVLGKAAAAEKKRIEEAHVKTTKEIKDAIPKQIAAARSHAVRNYIASLPVSPGSGGMSGVADRAGGIDAAGKEPVVACRPGFIEDAAQDAATLSAWQDWARQIGFPVR